MERKEPGYLNRLTGEFRDEILEREFRQSVFFQTRSRVRLLLSILAVMHLLIVLVELTTTANQSLLWISFALGALYMAASGILIYRLPAISDFHTLSGILSAYELLTVCIFLYMSGVSGPGSQLVQTLGTLLLMMLLIIIPNRLTYAVGLSGATLVAHMILFPPAGRDASAFNLAFTIVFMLSMYALAAAVSHRQACDRRLHYLDNRKLLRMSFTDPLTGIANRGKFNEALQSWVSCANDYDIPLSLVLFDFDDFKLVNDTFGHLVGDQVILQTVNLVDDAIRRRDIFARWGGEEFTLLFPDTQLDGALEIVERLRQTIESHRYACCGRVTASFGISQYHRGESPEMFMDRADRLLYRAKADGKNCIRSAS